MLYHKIKPDIWLNLAKHMSMCACRNALNRRLTFRERLEKVNNSFADANLFSLFVDAHLTRVKEKNLHVLEVFLGWLARALGE